MRPLVRAAIAAAAIVVVTRIAERALPASRIATTGATSASWTGASSRAPCPAGSLPDHGACIPVPREKTVVEAEGAALSAGEHIPRRPDRAEDPHRYRWPIRLRPGPRALAPSERFGVMLAADAGSPARVVRLDHQEGEAEIAFTGELVGKTVVTLHAVREGAVLRELLLVVGHLGRIAPELVAGARVTAGTTLGFVGTGDASSGAALYLAVRRVRDGVAKREGSIQDLVSDAHSVAVDPRNALAFE